MKLPRAKIIEILPLVIVAVLTIGFVIYDAFQPTTNNELTLNITLIVLGLLAIGQLAERLSYFERLSQDTIEIKDNLKIDLAQLTESLGYFEQLSSEIKEVKDNLILPNDGIILKEPKGWQDLETDFRSASEIRMSGGSFKAIVPRYARARSMFDELARTRGCRLRFILLDPESEALDAVAIWANNAARTFKTELKTSLQLLEDLQQANPNVEVRVNKTVPALTFVGTKHGDSKSKIRLDLNMHQCPPESRLYFELNSDNPGQRSWHDSFSRQFEELWNMSERWPKVGGQSVHVSK
jgi:hypothetical protein